MSFTAYRTDTIRGVFEWPHRIGAESSAKLERSGGQEERCLSAASAISASASSTALGGVPPNRARS